MKRQVPIPGRFVKVQREKVQQQHIRQLLSAIGATTYTLGTRRRRGDYQGSMQTPGIPDLLAFLPPHPMARAVLPRRLTLLFIEAKVKGGRVRPEQAIFRALCLDADIAHVVGDLDAVIRFLIDHGYITEQSVPHYRLPKQAGA